VQGVIEKESEHQRDNPGITEIEPYGRQYPVDDGEDLSYCSGNRCRAAKAEPHGQNRPEDPTPIKGQYWYEIEEAYHKVAAQNKPKPLTVIDVVVPQYDADSGDGETPKRPRKCNRDLRRRILLDPPFQPCDSPKG